ncbi:MAG: hypothetical protein B7Y40_05045 [Gammaproteobacteria bacterium 28-57-27]|nr:MAG: hypothetical protein B7Y40_05045 [Gammaproteobacteria bacterium 28-57-27]
MFMSRLIGSWAFALAFVLVFFLGVTAQAHAGDEPLMVTAPVTLDGVTLFSVRGISSLPAEKRAADIGRRIERSAADHSISTDALHIVSKDGMDALYAGNTMLVTLVPADAKIEEVDLNVLAAATLESIRAAMIRYRDERQLQALLFKSALALGTALGVALLIFLLIRFRRWSTSFVERRLEARLAALESLSRSIVRAQQVWQVGEALLLFSVGVLMLTIISLGVSEILAMFPWTRGLGVVLHDALMAPLVGAGEAFLAYLPKLITLLLIIMLFRFLLKMIRTTFEAIDQGRLQLKNFDPEWTWPTYKLVRFGVLAFAVVMAYPFIPGSQSEAFKGMTLLLGVLISIGSSSIISNVIAGYSMAYRRAFAIGDRIRVGETLGDVTERRLLVTHVMTPKNEEVVIPNSIILNSEIVNYSTMAKHDGVIVSSSVGIGYDTPWRQVESMLLLAASRTEGKKPGSKSFVRQKSLNSFDVTYEVCVFCDKAQQMPALLTELNRQVLDAFNEYGVQIMTPSYESDPDTVKIVPKDQWYAEPAQRPVSTV